MTRRRKVTFVLSSVLLWGLLGATLWGLLNTLEAQCKIQERQSGLWAECFGPAALIFTGLFGLVLFVDVIRIASVLWAQGPKEE
ncbi:hypothetical protein SAMN06272759_11263 [Novosphingobium sp. B1]|nr:hypothetical protein SAMN06272759_11263 [Novosphingobium sp. B1]